MTQTGSNHCVLVADDHPRFRRAVLDFLPEPPRRVIECADGREAVEAYTCHLPDLVLMDVEMPVMDGLAATRAIHGHFPEARVVVLTLHDTAGMRRAAEDAGATAFLSKSDLGELPALIRFI